MESSLPAPVKEFQPEILMCESAGMYISLPKHGFTFCNSGSHHHKGYEFILPITDMPLMKIENTDIYGHKYHVIPINPMQEHGVSGKMDNVRFISILFDDDVFNSIINDGFKLDHALKHRNFLFCNKNYPVSMELYTLIKIFIKESTMENSERDMILKSLSQTIAILIFRDIFKGPGMLHLGRPASAGTFKIKKVVEYIKENYQKECSLAELSQIAGISQFHLIRIFKESMGKTPYDYLLDIRIEYAKHLLTKGNLSVTEICHECGFNNMSHFIRTFKKKIGTSPSAFRNFNKLEQ